MTTPAPGPKDLARLFQGALTFELDKSSLQDPVAIAKRGLARINSVSGFIENDPWLAFAGVHP